MKKQNPRYGFIFYSGLMQWILALLGGFVICQGVSANSLYNVTEAWTTTGFQHTESVVYDPVTNYIYASNLNGSEEGDGYISRINTDGTVDTAEWAGTSSGGGIFNDPLGMVVKNTVTGGTLYVGDGDQLTAVNLSTGEITDIFETGVEGSNLNGLAVDASGNIYASDANFSNIYILEDGASAMREWLSARADVPNPNGLYVEDGKLIVGTDGGIASVDITTLEVTIRVSGIDYVDGIFGDNYSNCFYSNGMTVGVLKPDNTTETLVAGDGYTWLADISYSPYLNLLLVPDLDETIVAYRVLSANPDIIGISFDATWNISPGDSMTVTVNAGNLDGSDVYYKYYYCANYGTSGYDSTPWTVVQDYSTSNTCNYTFPSEGNYIVVVRTVTSPDDEPQALPIIGGVVTVGSGSHVNISSLTSNATGTISAGDTVTFTATASNSTSDPIYYEFYYQANYGISGADDTWNRVQEYSTANTCDITFPFNGNYIVVVRAVTDPENEPDALPIVGNVVVVQ